MKTKEKAREYSKRWYEKNREREAKKRKEYFKKNPKNLEHIKRQLERNVKYQKENKEEYNDYMREYMREKLNVKKHYINKMKILINEQETYEIKLPETINASGFLELLNQFDNIVKLIRLNSIQKEFNGNGVKRAYHKSNIKNTFWDTREKALDLLQYAYCGTQEDKDRIMKVMGKSWKEISKRLFCLVQKYNIKPNEVGLIKFKKRNEKGARREFMLPNYTIKSYTGIFDENGN